jgi:acyl dehydratase
MESKMSGLYFEQFNVGDEFITPARTITEADVVNFSGISGDYNPIHTDRVFCLDTPVGQPMAHGLLVISIATGLMSRLGIFDGTVIALLGMENWRFLKPVFFGDTVHVRMTIVDKRQTSHPGRGIIRRRLELINQRSELVQDGFMVLMCRCRPSGVP